MKVRTIRQHGNSYPPEYVKNIGRKYELPEADAKRLIDAGIVAKDKPGSVAEDKPAIDEG